jgi:hypothetical protein
MILMGRISLDILQSTIDLAIEAMPPDDNPQIVDCAVTIRDYLRCPEKTGEQELLGAVLELLEIAELNYQFMLAARLSAIARGLREFKKDRAA